MPRLILCKNDKKCNSRANLLDQDVEKVDDHGCPKIQDLVDPEADEKMWNCSRYPVGYKTTLQCAERKAKVCRNRTMQHLLLYF